ncbi:MAG: hypothetical protein WCO26_11360, partial [Deltaproteobacteria bacterium]
SRFLPAASCGASARRRVKKDELTVGLGNINKKFKTLLQGHKLLNEKIDRRNEENKAEHQQTRDDLLFLSRDLLDVRRDLTDHRENTELHSGRKKRKAS